MNKGFTATDLLQNHLKQCSQRQFVANSQSTISGKRLAQHSNTINPLTRETHEDALSG